MEPGTLRFVAKCLNQLRHRVPPQASPTEKKIAFHLLNASVAKTQIKYRAQNICYDSTTSVDIRVK